MPWKFRIALLPLTGTLPTCCGGSGQPYSVNYYNIDPNAVPPGAGTMYQTRNGYYRKFLGMEVSATKRMSNHWMARVGFSSNSWREYWKDGVTPTGLVPGTTIGSMDPTPLRTDPLYSGGLVFIQSAGSGKTNIFMALPKYQIMANGMYEMPYGVSVAANMLVRQGYPEPWDIRLATGDTLNSRKYILFDQNVENSRLPKVTTFDFRVGKAFKFRTATANVDLDIFNLFNAATVLQRSYQQQITSGATAYTNVMEIMQPRVVRIGLRFNF
jgi:hypothetical protein